MLIDTEQAKRRLLESGVTEEEARAHLDVLRMVDEQSRAALATKEDIQELRQETKQDLQSLQQEMKQGLLGLRQEMQQNDQALKQDLQELRSATEQDLQELRVELKEDIRALQTTMYRTVLAGVTFLSVLIALFRFI